MPIIETNPIGNISSIKIRNNGSETSYDLRDDLAQASIESLARRISSLENQVRNLEDRLIQKFFPNGVVVWVRKNEDLPFDFGEWETTDELVNYIEPLYKSGDSQTDVVTDDPAT